MTVDLLGAVWKNFDSFELRLLLDNHIGGPGQYDGRPENPNTLYLPLAREACRIALTFRGNRIETIAPGPAFDAAEWERVSREITASMLDGGVRVGRDYSFSGFRVEGSWKGDRSGVQIMPPPKSAPRARIEMAEHPFILEFPVRTSDFWQLTNHRRLREHRKLTLLLNVLLVGRINLQPRRAPHFWAGTWDEGQGPKIQWVQQWFFAELGEVIVDELTVPESERIEK